MEEAISKSSYCVAKVGGAGLGVFALETIPAGSFLWVFAGKRMRTGDRDALATLRSRAGTSAIAFGAGVG